MLNNKKIVSDKSALFALTEATEHYVRVSPNTEEYLTALWGSSDEDMYAVGDNGLILHWNGENWSACV